MSFSVLGKVGYFLVYFLMYACFMSVIYAMLGLTLDKDDDHPDDGAEYQQLHRLMKLFLFSYRNAVGDVALPDTTYWMQFKDRKDIEEGKEGWPLTMAIIIWLFWLVNNIFMVIILLNFLISIVSKKHDEALQTEEETLYSQISELNYELQVFKSNNEKDLFIIAANFEENDDDNAEENTAIEDLEKKLTKKVGECDTKISVVSTKISNVESELASIKKLLLDHFEKPKDNRRSSILPRIHDLPVEQLNEYVSPNRTKSELKGKPFSEAIENDIEFIKEE